MSSQHTSPNDLAQPRVGLLQDAVASDDKHPLQRCYFPPPGDCQARMSYLETMSAVGSKETSKDTVRRQCVEMCAKFTN